MMHDKTIKGHEPETTYPQAPPLEQNPNLISKANQLPQYVVLGSGLLSKL